MTIRCPSCGTELEGYANCPRCNFDPRGIALFDPKHFAWQALAFSLVAPAVLAGLNWGRLGDRRLKWLWIGGSVGALVAVMAALAALPDLGAASRILPWLVNVPVAMFLQHRQKALFAAHREAGGRTASVFKGTAIGIGATAAVVVPAVVVVVMLQPDPGAEGVKLLNAGRCAEAEKAFQRALADAPQDLDVRYDLALSYACQDRPDDAIAEFNRYLAGRPDDAEAHAWLAMIYDYRNLPDLADEHARKAEALHPGIIHRLFDEQGNVRP